MSEKESRKAKEEEAKPRRAVARPVKRMPTAKHAPMRRIATPVKIEGVNPSTVRGKIAGFQETAANMYAGVREIQGDIRNKSKEFQEATVDFYKGVAEFQSAILEQVKENQAYIRDFYG